MMFAPLFTLLTATLLVGIAPGTPTPTEATGESPTAEDAEALLDRMQAHLGRPATSKGARRLAGVARWEGMDNEGSFEEYLGGSGRARLITRFAGFGEFVRASDGERVWEHSASGLLVREGAEVEAHLRRVAIMGLEPWRRAYVAARYVGEETVEGRACHRLELVPRSAPAGGPRPDEWWLDRESLRPVRIDVYQGPILDVRIYPADWREVDGLHYPHRRGVEISGLRLNLEYREIEHGVALAEGFFLATEEVLVAARAMKERTRADADSAGDGPPAPPEIVLEKLERVHTAAVRTRCPAEDLQKNFGVILPETHRYAVSTGIAPLGHVFARYFTFGPDIEFEAGVIVPEPVEGAGRVKPSELPAGLTAVTWHVGPYHTLGDTHERMRGWLAENDLEVSGAPWEEYWTDPGMEPDSSKWRTRVLQPVRRRGD